MIIDGQRAYDCAPTLTDSEVANFCRDGVMLFEGVVPEHINRRCFDFLDVSSAVAGIEGSGIGEPVELFAEDWFVDSVLLCPPIAGAVRTLLGPGFGLPILIDNHRVACMSRPAGAFTRP